MSLVVRQWNWMIVLLVASSLGCRMGLPQDRNVQISQHLGGEEPLDSPPRTRLAAASTPAPTSAEPSESTQSTRFSLSDRSSPPAGTAQKQTGAAQQQTKAPRATGTATATIAGDAGEDAEAEFHDLLAAFRDSPPEVQQQAIRQLMAAAGRRASKTQQPIDIDEQLAHSLSFNTLPTLPTDFADAQTPPTRLAATSAKASSEPSDPSGTVSQAVAASADLQTSVTPASGTLAGADPLAAALQDADSLDSQDQAAPARSGREAIAVAGDAMLYDELVGRLRTPKAGESDGDRFRREIIKRYLQVLAGDPDTAVQTLEGLTNAEQEFLRHHLLALWNMTDPNGHPVTSRRFAAALPQFRSATRHLSEATEQLDIRSLAFCTEILSYGQVKRFTSNRFDAGQKVILYCEVDNFVAEKVSEGYETELQGSYEIFDASGTKVAGQVLPADRQVCDHYLRDYFIAYQMHLPSQLQAGDYRLELSMQCGKGHKYGQATIPLTIKK